MNLSIRNESNDMSAECHLLLAIIHRDIQIQNHVVKNIMTENKIYSDPDQCLDNTIKNFGEFCQAFEL